MLSALIVYFFFPHINNNHRARFLHPALIVMSVFMFMVGQLVIVPFLPRFTPVVLGYVSNITPERVIELTNQEREKAGLPPVEADPQLTQAALTKASYMFAKNYWAHTAPDGTEPWKFIADTGYKYRYAGENLARDFATPEAAVAAWMASPTHKENLLSNKYQDIGIAVVRGELGGVQTTLIVQFFGTKMSQAYKLAPVVGQSVPSSPEALGSKVSELIQEKKNLVLSPFLATKNMAIFLVSLFFLVLSIDLIVVKGRGVERVSSKSFAHILFLIMVLGLVYFSKVGVII